MKNVGDYLKAAGIFLKDTAIEGLESLVREETVCARTRQKEEDIFGAIRGFIDLKATDMDILEILQKHFEIDSIAEAKSLIVDARVSYQVDKLKAYLGLSGMDWVEYRNSHGVIEKLNASPKILEMPVEKLKIAIEKK